jgi:hypothetical protein
MGPEGTAEIVTLPEAMEPLVDDYRRLAGAYPDWGSVLKVEMDCD